ncbi:protein of unknown function [Burkholderia multivorans]
MSSGLSIVATRPPAGSTAPTSTIRYSTRPAIGARTVVSASTLFSRAICASASAIAACASSRPERAACWPASAPSSANRRRWRSTPDTCPSPKSFDVSVHSRPASRSFAALASTSARARAAAPAARVRDALAASSCASNSESSSRATTAPAASTSPSWTGSSTTRPPYFTAISMRAISSRPFANAISSGHAPRRSCAHQTPAPINAAATTAAIAQFRLLFISTLPTMGQSSTGPTGRSSRTAAAKPKSPTAFIEYISTMAVRNLPKNELIHSHNYCPAPDA